MGTRISSPGDTYYQGRGTRPTNTELGKTKTTPEEDKIIESLMAPRAKAIERMKKRGPKPA